MAKLFKVIMDILIILFIASFLALFVPPILGITTAVSEPGVESNLQTGTVAYGRKESTSNLAVGDTIIYNTEGKTYVYEIVEEIDPDAGTLTVKAYTDGETETIQARRTATKLLFYVPFIGYILIALHSTEGLIILGLVALLLIVLFIVAEILCRKKRMDGETPLTEEEEEEQDRKYFRDLAASQGKPNSLDSLGTLTIPPVAELMEEASAEIANANTIALDEEYENPELILEQVNNTDSAENADIPADSETAESTDSVQEEPKAPAVSSDTAAVEVQEIASDITAVEVQEASSDTAAVEVQEIASDITAAEVQEVTSDTAAVEVQEVPSDAAATVVQNVSSDTAVTNTAIDRTPVSSESAADEPETDFSNLGAALEIALENEQMTPTRHSAPKPEKAPEPEIEQPVEEIELAIPARTLDDLLQESYANGEDPKVTKDAATGITFVDFSNCLK